MHLSLQQIDPLQHEVAQFERREDAGLAGPAPALVGVHVGIDEDRVEGRDVSVDQRLDPSALDIPYR